MENTTNNPESPTPSSPSVETISQRLSDQSTQGDVQGGDGPKAVEPQAFDLTKFSSEQLQQLKAMLASTPDRVMMKQANPIVRLRRHDEKLIIDFKDTYTTMVKDELANMNKEVVMMPVRYLGADDFLPIPWKDFMNAEQVNCEVTHIRKEPGRIVEGQVVSKETGRLVEREVKFTRDFFTVTLPEGTTPASIELESRIFNA